MDLKRGRDEEEDTSIDINPKDLKYQRVNQDKKISENHDESHDLVESENPRDLDVPPTISPKLSLDSKSNELEFYCSICRSILINPVTLECGFFTKKIDLEFILIDRLFFRHDCCELCLSRWFKHGSGNCRCPAGCQRRIPQRLPSRNIRLSDIISSQFPKKYEEGRAHAMQHQKEIVETREMLSKSDPINPSLLSGSSLSGPLFDRGGGGENGVQRNVEQDDITKIIQFRFQVCLLVAVFLQLMALFLSSRGEVWIDGLVNKYCEVEEGREWSCQASKFGLFVQHQVRAKDNFWEVRQDQFLSSGTSLALLHGMPRWTLFLTSFFGVESPENSDSNSEGEIEKISETNLSNDILLTEDPSPFTPSSSSTSLPKAPTLSLSSPLKSFSASILQFFSFSPTPILWWLMLIFFPRIHLLAFMLRFTHENPVATIILITRFLVTCVVEWEEWSKAVYKVCSRSVPVKQALKGLLVISITDMGSTLIGVATVIIVNYLFHPRFAIFLAKIQVYHNLFLPLWVSIQRRYQGFQRREEPTENDDG